MKFVLDSNVFIEAHRRYYAFDLAPKFWTELVNRSDSIICIDRVKGELSEGKDQLASWVGTCACQFAKTNDTNTIKVYSQLMQWANNEPRFMPEARAEFARVADAWIVAYAKAYGYTVTTLEVPDKFIKKRIKIPDVCEAFTVPYVNTFTMLRQLGVKFL